MLTAKAKWAAYDMAEYNHNHGEAPQAIPIFQSFRILHLLRVILREQICKGFLTIAVAKEEESFLSCMQERK